MFNFWFLKICFTDVQEFFWKARYSKIFLTSKITVHLRETKVLANLSHISWICISSVLSLAFWAYVSSDHGIPTHTLTSNTCTSALDWWTLQIPGNKRTAIKGVKKGGDKMNMSILSYWVLTKWMKTHKHFLDKVSWDESCPSGSLSCLYFSNNLFMSLRDFFLASFKCIISWQFSFSSGSSYSIVIYLSIWEF